MHRQGGLKGWTHSSNSKKFSVARKSTKRSEQRGGLNDLYALLKRLDSYAGRSPERFSIQAM